MVCDLSRVAGGSGIMSSSGEDQEGESLCHIQIYLPWFRTVHWTLDRWGGGGGVALGGSVPCLYAL